jgi:hypothetical protein
MLNFFEKRVNFTGTLPLMLAAGAARTGANQASRLTINLGTAV